MTQLTEREQADVGNRSLKTPGSVSWSWQTITALQFMWENLAICHESYVQVWREAEEHAIWKKIPPDNPFGSKEAMLERLKIGDEDAAGAKIAGLAAVTKPLQPHGVNQHTEELRQLNSSKKRYRSDYLTARIARDRPDIHQRMLNGEFTTVAAAAREAGLLKIRPKSIGLIQDVRRVAANIRKHYTPDQVKELRDALQEEAQ